MRPHLVVRYDWNKDQKEGVDLDLLGKSMLGLKSTLQELTKVFAIEGELSVHVSRAKEGSIIFELHNQLITLAPFARAEHYVEFLRYLGQDVSIDALKLGSDIHRHANDYFSKNPLDMALLGYGLTRLFKAAKKQKNTPTLKDEDGRFIPKTYALRLNRLIRNRHGFKKTLTPFVESAIKSFEIHSPFKNESVVITPGTFDEYLSEDEQILPGYESGLTYEFHGQVVALERSMGEHVRIHVYGLPKQYALLTAFPAQEKTTIDYVDYYGKDVFFTAEVVRKSLYQRPKLKIEKMRLTHDALNL